MGSKRSRLFAGRAGRGTVALLSVALTLGAVAPAGAQDAEEVDGSADIRTGPLVGNGTFRDEIVTGELVWYSVLYTNYEELSISAHLVDADADASEELELLRMFVGTNLSLLESSNEDLGPGYTAWRSGGETETNMWFVGFQLNTTGQRGVLHELEFELSGFASANRDECGSDCTLDGDLDELEAQVADLEGQVEECGEECLERLDPEELEAARQQAESDIEAEQAAVIDLCGGEEECDPPGSSTPWPLVVVLFIAAAVAVGGLVRTLMQPRSQEPSAPPGGPNASPPHQPGPGTPATEAPA